MIKNILKQKYLIHSLCLISLISFGVFGASLYTYINRKTTDVFKTALSNDSNSSISLVQSGEQKVSKEKINIDTSLDKCEKYDTGDMFPDAITLEKQFAEYVYSLPVTQKNIYLEIRGKFPRKLFTIDKLSFGGDESAPNPSEAVLTPDEIKSMKGYYKGILIPFLGFAYKGETLISKYFEALIVAEANGDKQMGKYDPSVSAYNEAVGAIFFFSIIGPYLSDSKSNDATLAEMNKEFYFLKYVLGISKENARSLTEKEFQLYGLCKAKQDILDSKTKNQDNYPLAKLYFDSYQDNAMSKVDSLLNSYESNDDVQFNKDLDEVALETNKNNPAYEFKTPDEILEIVKTQRQDGYKLIKYLSDLDPKEVYSSVVPFS
jgi:hypothetical protein